MEGKEEMRRSKSAEDVSMSEADIAPEGPNAASPKSQEGMRSGSVSPQPRSEGATEAPGKHTEVMEQGGMSMTELIAAMKKDAKMQESHISAYSKILEETVQRNDELCRKSELESFEGEEAPITASAYVRRIMKYGGCSPCCIAVGFIYLERLKRRSPTVCLTSNNFQRLFLLAVMEAAKFLDDFYYSNRHWAEVGGISTKELNSLELEFLFRIGFNLLITREEYDVYVKAILDAQSSKKEEEGMGSKIPSFSNVAEAATCF
mmetsp:Transcript_1385/g.2307  ORF Transcript_1385/g.2307 Transcript_1385/m.2307 type:complete len:262 (+) Transcript_1385:500-1285(+)|eukprot:CAMPEP_0184311578 /NCGR_PEP_ID=MMETSP1049-20130417/42819_1 /TAXON_ID=77928 /ORGANISM="Proteomonas sulcata, Strain CCMP704" /LENGTH=261 /DNA_ID=CAMNT_0026627087 /DNA_START=456 /DNA_END=1241 /DNA_ORIENTATION=+